MPANLDIDQVNTGCRKWPLTRAEGTLFAPRAWDTSAARAAPPRPTATSRVVPAIKRSALEKARLRRVAR